MDILSVIGVIGAIVAVTLGQHLEGGTVAALLNGPAILIVMGGTLGAVMLETPFKVFARSIRIVPWVILTPSSDLMQNVDKIVSWGNLARKQGLLSLETVLEHEYDPYIKTGLQMLVDGADPKSIRSVMQTNMEHILDKEKKAATVFESMGGYSPTIGIIGAVMGLIHVMGNLSDPSRLGAGIAVAFIATIYGVGLANIIFIPIANKLRHIIHEKEKVKLMIMEGIISISEGENPRLMRLKLLGFT